MKLMKEFIFLIILFVYINNQVPGDKAINSCGDIGYEMPGNSANCKGNNEYCCFVRLKAKNSNTEKKFCATAPSKIEKADIENDINSLTDYTLEELICNNSKYLAIQILYLLIFILF